MTLENFINSKTQQKLETEAVTVRLEPSMVSAIDEFSLTLGITRQEAIAEFIKDSLKRALTHYEKIQNKPDLDQPLSANANGSSKRYYFLNTNKNNDMDDHHYMVSNGIAAAFYDGWKQKIDVLQENDVVFLYESGVGIVGVGRASGTVKVLDKPDMEEAIHQQSLNDYQRVVPMNAREIKKLTGKNMRFLHTMFNVAESDGVLIEKNLLSMTK